MLQEMDDTEITCVKYIKVGNFDYIQQIITFILPVTTSEILILSVQYDWMVRDCFLYNSKNVLRRTSPVILCIEKVPVYIFQT